ncbi:MAG: fibronectin type III domain-containing protein [Planctomycetes bacterium]|nr:fibronectin type III domain-containing protein [Planctomycetota bacterium]
MKKILVVLGLLALLAQSVSADEAENAPSELTATSLSSSEVVISWSDNSSDETGFVIERKTAVTGTYAAIVTTTANTTVYTDTALSSFTTYYYRLSAVNDTETSAYSNEVPAVTFNRTTAGDMVLQWKAEGNNLRIRVSAPTAGWVAVGFKTAAGKKDANIIMGYVKKNGVFIEDNYGIGATNHAADTAGGGTDNVTEKTGTEAKGTTELVFTIPLDSGDDRDKKLVVGNTYNTMLAYGKTDNFTGMHTFFRVIKIKIQ